MNNLFKLMGIIMIAVLVGLVGWIEDSHGENHWNVIHELYHADFGLEHDVRMALIAEYETILYLVDYTRDKVIDFNLHNNDSKGGAEALSRLTSETVRAYISIMEDITLFVNGWRGI